MNRLERTVYSWILLYGTIYIAFCLYLFLSYGWGIASFGLCIPGWFGYAVPFLIHSIQCHLHPHEIVLLPIDQKHEVRKSLIGWASISLASWAGNIAVLLWGGDWPLWAVMPTLGVFTWPLIIILQDKLAGRYKAPDRCE